MKTIFALTVDDYARCLLSYFAHVFVRFFFLESIRLTGWPWVNAIVYDQDIRIHLSSYLYRHSPDLREIIDLRLGKSLFLKSGNYDSSCDSKCLKIRLCKVISHLFAKLSISNLTRRFSVISKRYRDEIKSLLLPIDLHMRTQSFKWFVCSLHSYHNYEASKASVRFDFRLILVGLVGRKFFPTFFFVELYWL
jgi:hypothetical protein